MNLDWHRLKAVVFESDDWGLCAWVPDGQAHRVLAGTPAFRSPAGARYGRSTLESAADVIALGALLMSFRGGDGFPPVWQANTTVANPDYEALRPPGFEVETLPLVGLPATPSRWQRPGLWAAMTDAIEAGWWWPELHGLHHLPATAWLHALRRGTADARLAHEQQVMVCEAVEGSGEYDASEPLALRTRQLADAVERFTRIFGRPPGSFCPPDYRWDGAIEAAAEPLGVTTLQGHTEQPGGLPTPLRRRLDALRFPARHGARFHLPPRIAFEPRGAGAPAGPAGLAATQRAVRGAWRAGRPAIVSTHRANYAHLDDAWSEQGRAALRMLLTSLCDEGAVFLTDAEVRALVERSWSLRAIGSRGALLRYYGVPREALAFAAPPGVLGARVAEGHAVERAEVGVEGGEVRGRFDPGEYLIEWRRA